MRRVSFLRRPLHRFVPPFFLFRAFRETYARVLDIAPHVSILNLMVKFNEALLDRTFAALSDPTRRALLARLSGVNDLSVSELAEPFAMSLPAVMKHLDVLSEAGLITRSKTGRTVACRLSAGPMEEAMKWLTRYQRFWSASLDRLAAFVEEETACPPSRASPSGGASTARRRKPSAPGRKRRDS
ncbi:ArsR/SmtB family transcription factor [Paraburkholderia fungorum]|uniref:ArsR/SmtB family transcription factor n=2 Tax=Paraburkholderia fungorum TaxID=134537 RepID=UPI001F4874FE|nr:metalloregulator ArsR/SmtB family transcription factor [Paraburkholderia fungorum]